MNQALTSHIALQFVCACFRVSTGSVCLCVYSDRPRQQTPRHRLDHSQAGRQNTARQSDWQKRRQASERVNQQRMSKGAVHGAEHPEWGRADREKAREREEECLSVRLCVYALQRWLCALVSPLPCLSKWLSWVVQSCAETGLGCVFTDSPASGSSVCCRKVVLTGRQWQQLWRRRTTTKKRREGDRTALGIQILQFPLPPFLSHWSWPRPPLQKHQEVLAQLQQHCPCLFSEAEVGEREEAGRKDWENPATRKDEH